MSKDHHDACGHPECRVCHPQPDAVERAESDLACATDLINTWARECGVGECTDGPLALRNCIDRVWGRVSTLPGLATAAEQKRLSPWLQHKYNCDYKVEHRKKDNFVRVGRCDCGLAAAIREGGDGM